MAGIKIGGFGGISPKTPPRALKPTQAQQSLNAAVFTGSLKPLKGLGASVQTVVGTTQTIYKFGQDSTDETAGWLSWDTDVDVARGQINGDTEEWTFYTGDGYPKAVRAAAVGSPIHMGLDRPSAALSTALGSVPSNSADLALETRVYTYTYVYKIGGREIESAPAAGTTSVDVYPGQTVTLTGFLAPGTGYAATHVRVYRSTAGTFLFTEEVVLATAIGSGFADDVDPELLAEEIPSLGWLTPPDDMAGLTNLPNGIMAGFVGRDVYFCEPYVPHAWPDLYRQTIDHPVVGFGRMDTTLAVLTKGTPYLIQGSHPDSMVVVKSDIEQACVSKRSIVSINNYVIYCSPDGLVALTPGGSQIITESLYTYDQWQTQIDPTSVHAYHQDNKYIGFYNNGSTTGCFVFDLTTREFALSTLTSTAGYQSLRNDKLYLHISGAIKPWGEGSNLTYTWKSKIFTMPRPLGMSCAQVEAETYPVTAKIYADGVLLHTQTVQNRFPFRLPVMTARDWEVELNGTSEVFGANIAQSMEELANV